MKRYLEAQLIAPAARSWLQTATAARVLHIFDQSCNLVDSRGEILSLVSPAVGPGPMALVVSPLLESETFASFVNANTAVAIQEKVLVLGPLAIRTGAAKAWQPRPPWERLHSVPASLAEQVPLLEGMLQAYLAVMSLENRRGSMAALALTVAADPVSRLLRGLAEDDREGCLAGAFALAGLGAGLTPAGDDFLVGAIYALWATRPAEVATSLAAAITSTAAPRTTSLSAAWLRAAARGEAGAPWHSFVQASISQEAQAAQAAVARILATGHSSGADALFGFSASLRQL